MTRFTCTKSSIFGIVLQHIHKCAIADTGQPIKGVHLSRDCEVSDNKFLNELIEQPSIRRA